MVVVLSTQPPFLQGVDTRYLDATQQAIKLVIICTPADRVRIISDHKTCLCGIFNGA